MREPIIRQPKVMDKPQELRKLDRESKKQSSAGNRKWPRIDNRTDGTVNQDDDTQVADMCADYTGAQRHGNHRQYRQEDGRHQGILPVETKFELSAPLPAWRSVPDLSQ